MIVYYLGLANVQTDNQTHRHDRTSCTQCVIHVAYRLLQRAFPISHIYHCNLETKICSYLLLVCDGFCLVDVFIVFGVIFDLFTGCCYPGR